MHGELTKVQIQIWLSAAENARIVASELDRDAYDVAAGPKRSEMVRRAMDLRTLARSLEAAIETGFRILAEDERH